MNRSSTSPFRGTAASSTRAGGIESAQMLIRTLEQQNNALVQQINILKAKGKKMSELQDKIDMILRHNTQLLNENQRLAKLINQKKSQLQIWKNKHDSMMANRSTASDIQVKRLLNEIQKLKQQSCEIEHIKNIQINQIKNQQNVQIQSLKRNNLSNAEKYELEIRKLKEYCDKKDYEVSDLKMKIARIGKQTDFQIGKLREQKERLRSDLQFEEAEHRKQVQSLKSKFDYNFHTQIENLKKQHINQLETIDYENQKLKQVLTSKNLQLEQSLSKQSKMRNNFQDTIQILKKQNNELKDKLIENEHIADTQLNNLREKLDSIKESELTLLKDSHANQIDILNREISKLHKILDSRNLDIQDVCKERNQIRQALEAEGLKLKAALDAQVCQNKEQSNKHEQALRIRDEDFKYLNEEMRTLEDFLKNQIEAYKKQKQIAESLLHNSEQQLDRQRKETRQTFSRIQIETQQLKQQLNQARDQLQRTTRHSTSQSNDLIRLSTLKTNQLNTKIANLQQECTQYKSLVAEYKQNQANMQNQLDQCNIKISYLQSTQKQLRSKLKDTINRYDIRQKEFNKLMKEQIENLGKGKKNQIQQLKSIHENKIKSLQHQLKELQKQIDDKNRVINNIKLKYDELVNGFQKIFAQEAARKNLDIKVPGWLPQTLALKALFDVFLKNKVLEYCS